MDTNKMTYDKDLRKGIVKIMILSYIKKHRTYPYQLLGIIKSLKPLHDQQMRSSITKNDIYNMTSALEKGGYIRSSTVMSGRKAKKIFAITKRGQGVVKNKNKIFFAMISQLKRLVKEEFDD